jgi:phage repressor protein C with HTH and peptisase S24 domain
MDWAEKIQIIEGELGIENDRGRLAKLLGVRPGVISDIKNGKARNPGSNIALLLINKLGINPKWLENDDMPIILERLIDYPFDRQNDTPKSLYINRTASKKSLQSGLSGSTIEVAPEEGGPPGNTGNVAGERDMVAVSERAETVSEAVKRRLPVIVEGGEKGVLIPVIGQGLSAGLGFDYDEGEVIRFIKIPAWIARKGPDLVALPIYGDSMEPTMGRGDLAVCDGGGFKDDGIYVLRDEERGLMFCKRVVWAPGGWTIMSDNPRYEPMKVDDRAIQIVARVIAAVKEVK